MLIPAIMRNTDPLIDQAQPTRQRRRLSQDARHPYGGRRTLGRAFAYEADKPAAQIEAEIEAHLQHIRAIRRIAS